MNIGILGTGVVGQTIGSKLVELGHAVHTGSCTSDNSKASAWAEKTGSSQGTFTDARLLAKSFLSALRATAHFRRWRWPEVKT